MEFSENIRLVNLELFDAAFLVKPGTENAVKQRFMTLFVHEDSRHRGGSATVCKATNVQGETFAFKRLRVQKDHASATPQRRILRNSLESQGGSSGTPDYVTKGHVAAFYEEYRVHLAVSSLRGFPKLYGFGFSEGDPVIIMEWVEGTTLHDALGTGRRNRPKAEKGSEKDSIGNPQANDPRAATAEGNLSLQIVADMGIAVCDLLMRAAELDSRFVHRDISPRNIMLRTDERSVDEQLASENFDLCLIDFGSAALATEDPTFTMSADIWRMGTPAYAPPEMLTPDIALPEHMRQSEAIDSYALCSVLYELYSGCKPFEIKKGDGLSPYRVKTETTPAPLAPRNPDAGALAAVIEQGLSVSQEDRPSIAQLKSAFENWKADPAQRAPKRPAGSSRVDQAIWQPGNARKAHTRRAFVAAGIVSVAAVAAGVLVASKPKGGSVNIDPARYPMAEKPYEGAPLFKALDHGNASWMLCTAQGDIACKPASSRPCGALREGTAALYDDISQLYGYIAPDGSGGFGWTILPSFSQVKDFSEGLSAAQDAATKLWGFIDGGGAWAIAPQYESASSFSNGFAAVASTQFDDSKQAVSWSFIDNHGKRAFSAAFTSLGSRDQSGCTVAEEEPGSWGLVDADGTWASERRFGLLRRLVQGLAPAFDTQKGLWGYVDEAGTWAIDARFADARPFSEGCAAVQDEGSLLWYFIGPDGTAHGGGKPRFWKLGDLHDGLAPAQASAADSVVVFDPADQDARSEDAGGRYGYVDARGEWHMKRLTELVDTDIGPAQI